MSYAFREALFAFGDSFLTSVFLRAQAEHGGFRSNVIFHNLFPGAASNSKQSWGNPPHPVRNAEHTRVACLASLLEALLSPPWPPASGSPGAGCQVDLLLEP